MHTWDPRQFRSVLAQLRAKTGLGDAGLATLAGKSRSQVNRWSRAENQPGYDGLANLAAALRRDGWPDDVIALGDELIRAAGYATADSTADIGPPTDEGGARRLTVIVNPEDPEPDLPPGGLRDQVERIIWAIDEDWTIRWAQIQARRAILSPPPSSPEEQRRTGNDR